MAALKRHCLCLLLLLVVMVSPVPQGTPLSGNGEEVVVKDILEKVLEGMQLKYIKSMKFCDENSGNQKAPYICLAKKLPPTECSHPIRVGDLPPFCQDMCPPQLQEDREADLYMCRKVSI
ncbi:uncharacterized protein LOC122393215 [Amphibalanus amphitrite]|uniref:uncharacterized protein LOC122393215 n=1 Tax=Amphibalanus amphitrite TaxID=1232801 RepID=UPI001C929FA7|nr:uncharacterized protein LOC122393215 [Amphibalanus amphitrite]